MGTKRAHGSKSEPVRKIGKTGTYTYYVTLPKSVVDEHMGVIPKSNRPEDNDPDKVVDGTSKVIDDE